MRPNFPTTLDLSSKESSKSPWRFPRGTMPFFIPIGNLKVKLPMKEKPDVLQGTLALMVLKTLDLLAASADEIAERTQCLSMSALACSRQLIKDENPRAVIGRLYAVVASRR